MTWLRELICRHFHGKPFHPIRGQYRCRVCLRVWRVEWER